MSSKLAKLTMLSMLFTTALGLVLTSGVFDTLSLPTKQAVSYATSDDLNSHDTNHSSSEGWKSFNDSITTAGGTLTGGSDQSEMVYYYLEEDVTFTSNELKISRYVTLCLNGKTLKAADYQYTISLNSNSYFNLCDCSSNDSGTVEGVNSGGGVFMDNSTFNMYGGTITGNTSESNGGGVYVLGGTLNMYGGTITGNTSESYGGGVVLSSYGTFNMYDGTISSNTATNGSGVGILTGTFYMYGGYLNDSLYKYTSNGTISIKGGYISSDAYRDIDNDWLTSDYQVVDISTLGTYLDENYVGYPYAVYKQYTMSSTISTANITYGTTYTLDITDSYTKVVYTWKDASDNTIVGFPTDIGEYIVTAYFLYTTVEDDITTNYYFTGNEFTVTISKGQAVISADATQSKTYDGTAASVDYTVIVGDTDITSDATVTETWYDESDEEISAPTEVGTYKVTLTVDDTTNYDGTSVDVTYTITEVDPGFTVTPTDSNGLSAGEIAGIVIASIFVVGLIAFLVYFLFFRKKKATSSK